MAFGLAQIGGTHHIRQKVRYNMLLKIIIILLIINAVAQWQCIIGCIDDIIKIQRSVMTNEHRKIQ